MENKQYKPREDRKTDFPHNVKKVRWTFDSGAKQNGEQKRNGEQDRRKPAVSRDRRFADADPAQGRGRRKREDNEQDQHGRQHTANRRETTKSHKDFRPRNDAKPAKPQKHQGKETTRLNKYIANAGICSRREADKLIEAGSVKVNGEVVTQMGYQVKPGDVVAYGGETLSTERKRYFLMNKPKGYITTVDDPQERKTVMMLIDGACRERIYPVGRLDRNTTGLLLFTNDGELARKLMHPSTMVYKVYQVELNKAVSRQDMKQMLEGIELDDGMIKVDDVQYAEGFDDKRVVGVALHSGRNRIVRRIFEHLGYEVHKLDRVVFAGLTKKDLPRGRYRELTEKEGGYLRMV